MNHWIAMESLIIKSKYKLTDNRYKKLRKEKSYNDIKFHNHI